MAIYTVDDRILTSDTAANYFNRVDRRVKQGIRATLQMLGLPCPEYAQRQLPGPQPLSDMLKSYAADNPRARTFELAPRKENALAERIAAIHDARADKLAKAAVPNLFDQTFSG